MPDQNLPPDGAMLPLSAADAAAAQTSLTRQADAIKAAHQRNAFMKWFWTLAGMLVVFGLIYLTLHFKLTDRTDAKSGEHYNKIGYEYARLSADQEANIALIYVADNNAAPVDSGAAINTAACSSPACKAELAMEYLDDYYNRNLDTAQRADLQKHLSKLDDQQAISFLHGQRLRVKSYFWLTGPAVYFEIMFWSLFGVLCSLLYMLSDNHRKNSDNTDTDNPVISFDKTEVPYQVAKMFYAPFTILIIILGYNYIQGDNVQDISTSKGMLVFAFLGGFFSGRVMTFLNRLKDALLPVAASATATASAAAASTAPAGTPADQSIVLQVDDGLDPALRDVLLRQGLEDAEVTLTNEAGQVITARPKAGESPAFTYIAPGIVPGNYTLDASWAGGATPDDGNDAQDLQLVGRDVVKVESTATAISLIMHLSAH